MAKGDTKTEDLLDILGSGGTSPYPRNSATKTQNYIMDAIDRLNGIEEEVAEIKNNPDVVDIVSTYADLQAYDTQHLTDKDIIRVLQDETHDGESTYYRYSKQSNTWTYIGESKQYGDFVGTDGTAAGAAGLVPAPATTDAGKFLKADGTWDDAAGSTYTAGVGIDITNAVISATNTGKARVLTTDDYNYPTNNPTGVALWLLDPGLYNLPADVVGYTQIYFNVLQSALKGNWLVAHGIFGDDPSAGLYLFNGTDKPQYYTTKISDGSRFRGQTFFTRVVDNLTSTGTDDALSAKQGKVLKDLIDSIAIKSAGAPTTATVGTVGQLLEDTTNGKLYQCTAIDNTDPQNIVYTWTEAGGGGGGGVIELTSSDYNYHKTGDTDDGIAYWLLPNGMYANHTGSNLKIYRSTTSSVQFASDRTFIIFDYFNTKYMFWGGNEYNQFQYYKVRTNGTTEDTSTLISDKQLVDNLAYPGSNGYRALDAAQGPVIKGLIDAISQSGSGAPTTSTTGTVGQLYQDTTNGKLYICTAVTPGTDPDPDTYTWSEVGAGGSGPTVVQTTGTSTTDVMSQNAITSMVFADPSTKNNVQLGKNSSASGYYSVALGYQALAQGNNNIAIGRAADVESTATNAIALGEYSYATSKGQMDISTLGNGDSNTEGYNNSTYRLLTGLYDPQSAHDAATKGYVDPTSDSSAPTTATVGRLGQIQIDTSNNDAYMCVAVDSVTPAYTWKKITA